VRRADGQPVEDAKVVLADADGHEVATVRTGADGGYSFGNLHPGSYTLLTMGYPPFPAEVRVPDGEQDDEQDGDGKVDLELTRSPD